MPDEKKKTKERNSIIALVQDKMKADGSAIDPAISPDLATISTLDTFINRAGEQAVRVTLPNVRRILTNDPRFKGKIRFNRLSMTVEFMTKPIRDVDEAELVCRLGDIYAIKVTESMVSSACRLVAEGDQYHPVVEYFEGLSWDGTKRIDGLLTDFFGAKIEQESNDEAKKRNEIVRVMGRRFMISAVARAYEMGCKVDTVLILSGPQGCGKSTGLQALAGEAFYSDTQLDLNSKDALMQLKGVFLYEMSEMDSLKKSEQTRIKAFISSRVDRYRPSYGRNVEEHPRGCVFVGTTNEQVFLSDSTGSRRFFPARVGLVNIPKIKAERDQLWAEAVAAYKSNEVWYLTSEEEKERREIATKFELIHPWTEDIYNHLKMNLGPVTVHEIMNHAIKIDVEKRAPFHAKKITEILRHLGREPKRIRKNGKRVWAWVQPGS